jgi:hypothetical protein
MTLGYKTKTNSCPYDIRQIGYKTKNRPLSYNLNTRSSRRHSMTLSERTPRSTVHIRFVLAAAANEHIEAARGFFIYYEYIKLVHFLQISSSVRK